MGRRGDVLQSHNPWRYTNNAEIGQGLTALEAVQSVKIVHFFSEGGKQDFQEIIDVCVELSIECVWHLNGKIKAAHYSLSIADILVVAGSSFSASAALLNQG